MESFSDSLARLSDSFDLKDAIFVRVVLEEDADVPVRGILHQVFDSHVVLLCVAQLLPSCFARLDVGVHAPRCVHIKSDWLKVVPFEVPLREFK